MPTINLVPEYVPTEWVNGTAPAINAINLNHMELGIEAVTNEVLAYLDRFNAIEDRLDAIDAALLTINTRLDALESAPPAHTHPISEITSLQTELNRTPKGSWSRSGTTLSIDIEGS